MNVLLAVLFTCVGLGLLAPRLGRNQHLIIVALATLATALYIVFPQRFI